MSFFESVYDIVRQIPPGYVASYGQIARMLNAPKSARIVGYALHVNPEPGTIPCHRVVNRYGRLADAFAFGGVNMQRVLLEGEGVEVGCDDCVDMERYAWRP